MVFLIWFLLVISVILDASSDAIVDKTDKRNHWLELIATALIASAAIIYSYNFELFSINGLYLLLSYMLIRLGFFNLAYNNVRNLGSTYIGNTSVIDKLLDKSVKYVVSIFTKKEDAISKVSNGVIITIYVISVFASLVLISKIV